MKKLFSILIASIIILSGMHLSVANHFCGGMNVATKVSFDEEKATCGMEHGQKNNPLYSTIEKNCCHDELSVCAVDNQYVPSSFELNKTSIQLLNIIFVPISFLFHSPVTTKEQCTNVFPPGNYLPDDVSLSRICVFRI